MHNMPPVLYAKSDKRWRYSEVQMKQEKHTGSLQVHMRTTTSPCESQHISRILGDGKSSHHCSMVRQAKCPRSGAEHANSEQLQESPEQGPCTAPHGVQSATARESSEHLPASFFYGPRAWTIQSHRAFRKFDGFSPGLPSPPVLLREHLLPHPGYMERTERVRARSRPLPCAALGPTPWDVRSMI
ncbi:hypothetical protein OH76DRAFT_585534 [Lentinus brumalis]|uniref:Uncharacterized protein n=1 Tax=Lentinus brumalis TaxID=2498619 RepID=A0A371DTS3_9APHY|nr:hypothetical protein OH76DRAFT_585534 [Polyporus brumalis]